MFIAMTAHADEHKDADANYVGLIKYPTIFLVCSLIVLKRINVCSAQQYGIPTMSKRVPGMSQEEMMAKWKEFVMKEFRKTGLKTKFNQVKKNVYTDGEYLYVLDDWHGDLEVLKYQKTKGPAEHLGSCELEPDFEMKAGEKVGTLKKLRVGKLKKGGKKHEFVLI
jgi:hypothetical protein